MRNMLFATVATVATLMSSASFAADERNITFVNATGYGIRFIGVNPPGDNDWDENELSSVLRDKASVYIKFNESDKGCRWNIKITWASENSSGILRNVDLCKIDVITLHYNERTEETSYTSK